MIGPTNTTRRFSWRSSLSLTLLAVHCYHAHSLAMPGGGGDKRHVLKIQVCQNKDCCKRYQGNENLVQTLSHLVPPSRHQDIEIETVGCLSKCAEGPNVQVNDQFYNDVHDVQSAAAILEMAFPNLEVPPTLIAASNVIERAHKATSFEEKLKLLNSVINALNKNEELNTSKIMAHAYAIRAQVYFDYTGSVQAKEDAIQAVTLNPSHPFAWRLLADTEETMGNTLGAMEALTQWVEHNPEFSRKVQKEKDRLSEKMKS